MLTRWLSSLFLLVFFAATGFCDGDAETAFERQNLLKAELAAAQTGKFYVVFDLKSASFLLKNRGVVFKEWKALSAEYWGTAIPAVPTTLTKREAPDSPERTEITPVDENGLTPDGKVAPLPDPFEVVDMPVKYSLLFPQNVTVHVSTPVDESKEKFEKFKEKFSNYKEKFVRNLKLPFILKEKKEKKEDFANIELVMTPADAQALYWAFPEGTTTIFTDKALR
ncbi:hypothetical protein EPN96_02090 [bacterium]|nr:MAG: hypothetical protein EPN96_02090 [bacterium]